MEQRLMEINPRLFNCLAWLKHYIKVNGDNADEIKQLAALHGYQDWEIETARNIIKEQL